MSPLERLAVGGLPALEQVERDGWLLRSTPGTFKRSNSALALAPEPGPVAVVEDFYADRGVPARVQVTGDGVDVRLAGWVRHDRVLVLTAALPVGTTNLLPVGTTSLLPVGTSDGPLAPVGTRPDAVELRVEPWDAWFDCWWAVDGRPGGARNALAQLALVEQDSAYAALHVAGQLVAVGRGTLADGWLGIFGMAVLPQHRGAARRLHSSAGFTFTPEYAHRYRTRRA